MEDFGISENLYENLFNKKLYSKDTFSFLFQQNMPISHLIFNISSLKLTTKDKN